MAVLTISGRGEGTVAAASAGRGDGAGTAARDGCRGECTGAPGSARKPFAALSFQQCSLPWILRYALGNLARASFCVMQAGEP
jgi:hypothetical protein